MMISPFNINYTFNLHQSSPLVRIPAFKGELNEDKVEFSEPTPVNYKKLQFILNSSKKNNKMNFNKELLDDVQKRLIERSVPIKKYEYSLGLSLQKFAIRNYLLTHIPTQSPFAISLLSEEVEENLKKRMGTYFECKNIEQRPGSIENDDVKTRGEKNFAHLLTILYDNKSSKFVYDYLKPIISEEVINLSNDNLEHFIKRYYEDPELDPQKFSYTIERNVNGFTVKSYLDDEIFLSASGNTPGIAKRKMFNEILKHNEIELNVFDKVRRLKRRYTGNKGAKDACEKALKQIGFLPENEKLNEYSDRIKIEYITRALDLSTRLEDPYRFQTLEYYGDSIINMLVGKFLVSKDLPKEDTTHYYSIMTNNKTLALNTINTGLYKHMRNFEHKEIEVKDFADAFEAMVGALYLSYPEEEIYEFLKPIFEQNLLSVKLYHEAKNANNIIE